MSNLPVDLDFSVDRSASPERMNRAMSNIDARLRALETYKPNFDAELALIQQVGLDRLNNALTPVYQSLTALADLGAIFEATSTTLAEIATGTLTLLVPTTQAAQFAPARWLSVMSSDATAMMAGLMTSWDRTTGTLRLNVMETYGQGQFSSWLISPSSPPFLAAAVVDGGNIDSAVQSIAVPYTYNGPTISDNLMDGGTI